MHAGWLHCRNAWTHRLVPSIARELPYVIVALMPTIRAVALSGSVIMLTACGGGDNSSSQIDSKPASHGRAQKGPYQTGSPVTLYELDANGGHTGRTASTQVESDGQFTFNAPWTGPTELEVTGHYFDESNGIMSDQPGRLTAWIDLPATDITCINLFTHLVAARMQVLMASGEAFESAQGIAHDELRTLFDLVAVNSHELARLDLSDGQSANAIDNANLLLFSTALLSAGIDQTGIDAFYSDFADDARLNGVALPQWIRTSVYAGTVDLDQVKITLETLDGVEQAPGFDDLNSTFPSWVTLEGDLDGDGLSDPQEVLLHGSDPLLADTDGDGLTDGWETTHLLDLFMNDAGDDPDSDGLNNLDEFTHLTNPRASDSDGDGMPDAWEVVNLLDPLIDEAGGDMDGDELSNRDEFNHLTNPQVADSDGDGLPDGWEVTNLFNPLLNDASEDPDGDGLDNLNEYSYATNPGTADTDGDTYTDGFEISGGGDPNDAASLPLAFTSSPATSGESGFSYIYPVQISWASASFSLDTAPSGMSIDSDTGIINWVPTLMQTGISNVTVRATTGLYSRTQSFSITMTPGNTGDINEDGVVDAKDILLSERAMLKLMVPSATQLIRGDVVADGAIQNSDVIAVQRLALGL